MEKQIETLNTELTRARKDYQSFENETNEKIHQLEEQIATLKMQVSILILILFCVFINKPKMS